MNTALRPRTVAAPHKPAVRRSAIGSGAQFSILLKSILRCFTGAVPEPRMSEY